MKITNIKWDTEENRSVLKELPIEVQMNEEEFLYLLENETEDLEDNDDLIEVIAEEVSNKYGWGVYSFNIEK